MCPARLNSGDWLVLSINKARDHVSDKSKGFVGFAYFDYKWSNHFLIE